MKKRFLSILMLMAMCLALVVSASAADITDPVGRIHCDVITDVGSYLNGNSPTDGGDTFCAKATSIVSGRTAGETMNIYARSDVMSPDQGETYAYKESTEHYKTRTSATTNKIRRSWYQEELPVLAVGLSRARYTNNKVSVDTGGYLQGTIGGDYLRSANATSTETRGDITLGIGKENNMISVIDQVFGKDLSSYDYISFAELWTNNPLPPSPQPIDSIFTILVDIYMDLEVGERVPLGFLYQGNEVYTVVEQPSGDLKLTTYEIQTTPPPQNDSASEMDVLPEYHLVSTETASAPQSVVHSLYE